jgi:hypothetical protein
MTVRKMYDIGADDARGADLFIFGRTKEPRGQYMVSAVGIHSRELWEIRQTGTDIPNALAATGVALDVGVDKLGMKLAKWIETCGVAAPRIAIDISCMSRPTMAAAFQAVIESAVQQPLWMDVLYVVAEFTVPPTVLPPNEDIRPINDWFAGWPTNATASTSLVVGLGYERDKASGASEYFDAGETWVFVPQSAIGAYEAAVVGNNEALLARARRRDQVTTYRVECPTETFGLLAGAVSRIVPKMNPVLLPFGPKVFFALSLLVAAIYREVGVWHVTGDSSLPDTPHQPSRHVSAFRVELGRP